MARTSTRRTHRAPGSKTARRTRKTPIRSQTPQRRRAPSRPFLQHRADLTGASLVAAGIFLAFVEYRGWDGGVVGLKIDNGLHLLIGRAAAIVPPLAIALGAAIFLNASWHRI